MGIHWTEMMSVGVPALDDDHKTLVKLLNVLHRSIGDPEEYGTLGTVLEALVDYARHHFVREERMMQDCNYPQLDAHRQIHDSIAAKVVEYRRRYDEDQTSVRARECLDFLHNWLIEHICTNDMDYRPWLIGQAIAVSNAERVGLGAPELGRPAFDWRSLRILVVDDNQNFCQVLRAILEGVGVADIAVANDVATAQAALEGRGVDAVVTDWHVGQDNGLDLVRWIRTQPRLSRLPVVMLSGHETSRDLALAGGADQFMEKPISARGLLICLGRLLHR
ncbi:MAG: bacteriohemerythrin [Magnetospirillum sp.]|nr:bacteriohemerythrin [Magnetospirillum sp.]